MAFLCLKDYYAFIAEVDLNQILEQSTGVSGDPDVLDSCEKKSIARAKEYLTSRYKVNRVFAEFIPFDLTTEYTYGDRINLTADAWESSVYLAGEMVEYLGNVYLRNSTTSGYTAGILPTNTTYFSLLGEEGLYYIAFPEDFDEDKIYVENDLVYYSHEIYKKNSQTISVDSLPILPTNTIYYTRIRSVEYSDYLTVVGVNPSDNEWTMGDNRNQTVVECIVHMTLNKIHSLINPRNIPSIRMDNFSTAIATLKEFQMGDVQADLPDREGGQTGYSIRFGSNQPTTHGY